MYSLEILLQKDFVCNLKKKLKENEFIAEEFNARFGNVDIIKASYNKLPNINEKQAELLSNIAYSRIIALLNKKSPRTFNFLKKNSDYTNDYLKLILSRLIKAKIVISNEKYYLIDSNFEYPKLNFISYEAKLKDWKKALSQALKNKRFSRKSYIVMPMNIAKHIYENKNDLFKMYNVGIIGVNNKRNVIFYNPKVEDTNAALLLCSIGKFMHQNNKNLVNI